MRPADTTTAMCATYGAAAGPFCDDAHCQRVSGGFEAVASGAARTHGLVFLYRRLEMEAGGTETATVRLEPRLTEGILQW